MIPPILHIKSKDFYNILTYWERDFGRDKLVYKTVQRRELNFAHFDVKNLATGESITKLTVKYTYKIPTYQLMVA